MLLHVVDLLVPLFYFDSLLGRLEVVAVDGEEMGSLRALDCCEAWLTIYQGELTE